MLVAGAGAGAGAVVSLLCEAVRERCAYLLFGKGLIRRFVPSIMSNIAICIHFPLRYIGTSCHLMLPRLSCHVQYM